MMPNGDRFEAAYNKIAALLRKKVRGDRWLPFSSVVHEVAENDATVRAIKDDLLQYGDLRNAIVHDRGKAPKVLADPRDDVVTRIEEIWDRLSRPRILRSLPRPVPLQFFDASVLLQEPLSYMRENDFSQAIVFRNGKYVILSTEGNAHWLESKAKEDIIALSEVQLSDVLECEPKDTCVYLRANDSVDLAREIFANDIGKRVFSVLVSESGKAEGKPINIVTPWDFI
ncbi:MAG TPA: hypothetical protein VLZ74_05140 [Methylocella sp.]|nr:hypothetical protein [Methylocella sp.]